MGRPEGSLALQISMAARGVISSPNINGGQRGHFREFPVSCRPALCSLALQSPMTARGTMAIQSSWLALFTLHIEGKKLEKKGYSIFFGKSSFVVKISAFLKNFFIFAVRWLWYRVFEFQLFHNSIMLFTFGKDWGSLVIPQIIVLIEGRIFSASFLPTADGGLWTLPPHRIPEILNSSLFRFCLIWEKFIDQQS